MIVRGGPPPYRVLHVTEGLGTRFGGTAVAVAMLADALSRRGVDTTVLCLRRTEVAGSALQFAPEVRVLECRQVAQVAAVRDIRGCMDAVEGPAIVHIHGLWCPFYAQVARLARRRQWPVVVTLHGMLEPSALRRSARRKAMAWWLYQRRLLAAAAALHATSALEANHALGAGLDALPVVIPWGVSAPNHDQGRSTAPFGLSKELRVALFLSRLHPQKGIELLLRSWARIETPGWVLVLAGPGHRRHEAAMKELAARLGIADRVVFPGAVDGANKEALLRRAEFLVLPSPSESFGIVVAEALSRSLPVIATRGTPWSSLAEHGCGWWVSADAQALAAALLEAVRKRSEDLREMGRRGKHYVERAFSVDASVRAMMQLYQRVLADSFGPDCQLLGTRRHTA